MNVDTAEAPATGSPLRTARLLVTSYLGLSVLTLAAAILLRNNASLVTDAVWVRGTIVVLTGMLMLRFAVRAGQGSRPAFRRLRAASATMVVAIVVIISLPGVFPLWMKLEQGVCGALLLGVVVLVNGSAVRSRFAAK